MFLVTRVVLNLSEVCQIFLAGLVLQLASFIFFCVIYTRFLYKVHVEEQAIWMQDSKQHWNSDWRTLAAAMAISSIGILVRLPYSNLVAFNKHFCRFVRVTVLRRSLRAFTAVSAQARQPSTWVIHFPFLWPS